MKKAHILSSTKPFALAIALVTLGLVSAVAVTHADQPPSDLVKPKVSTGETYTLFVPNYSNVSPDKINQMTDYLSAQQEAIKANLLFQLTHKNLSDAAKSDIIYALGGLRVYQATDDLINDIAFVDQRPYSKFHYQPHSGYVAQKSLSNIGLFAFGEIMDVMSNRKRNVPFVVANTDAYAWVLWAIEGKRCALIRLQDRLAGEKNPKVRVQYTMVIKQLKRFANVD